MYRVKQQQQQLRSDPPVPSPNTGSVSSPPPDATPAISSNLKESGGGDGKEDEDGDGRTHRGVAGPTTIRASARELTDLGVVLRGLLRPRPARDGENDGGTTVVHNDDDDELPGGIRPQPTGATLAEASLQVERVMVEFERAQDLLFQLSCEETPGGAGAGEGEGDGQGNEEGAVAARNAAATRAKGCVEALLPSMGEGRDRCAARRVALQQILDRVVEVEKGITGGGQEQEEEEEEEEEEEKQGGNIDSKLDDSEPLFKLGSGSFSAGAALDRAWGRYSSAAVDAAQKQQGAVRLTGGELSDDDAAAAAANMEAYEDLEGAERELQVAAQLLCTCLDVAEEEAVRVARQLRGWCRARARTFSRVVQRELQDCAEEQQGWSAVCARGVGVLARLQAVERAQVRG